MSHTSGATPGTTPGATPGATRPADGRHRRGRDDQSRPGGPGPDHGGRRGRAAGRRPIVARSDWTSAQESEALRAAGLQRLPVAGPDGRLAGVISWEMLLTALRGTRPG